MIGFSDNSKQREVLDTAVGKNWQEWEILRDAAPNWPESAKKLHRDWWEQRIARQKEIDTSIAAKAEFEYLYDKPFENKGIVRVAGPEGIACWFIDTDYNEESFFVRRAYFLGANDPYKALKTTLKAEINEDAWASLHSDTSRPFAKPRSGRIAVKVINHLGDEVMKVFRVN